ncbi:L-fuconate dehydratase [Microbacterium aerolatum]|uniref:L-fuconate dehydratase n=1 Tax=Microbacterium aerolatum TaxID=153731 RepID=A0A511AEP7_9MICO|nr:L-fuconate dehydratase [Microbacterium aerolatum]GEK85863.1 l-fuconate dehydratase [Microbacterium aerolatum]GGB19675.1 l-fuconate dehydratase [Microbacterium aerolatum]
MSRIVALDTTDIRFPTSLSLDGSDAMNPDPDYSAAYVVIRTDADADIAGHSFVFTIGRGNDVQVAAIDALAGHLVGREIEPLLDDMGGTFRDIIGDSQLRWLGPEKGVMHMAIGAVINALWDIKAKRAGLPLWQLLSRMTPEEIVDLVDFRYLTNALTREEALEILRAGVDGREQRETELLATGFPAYTTSPGWLGYSDEKLERLAREALADGFTQIKLKVGADLDDDIRRFRKAREVVGPDFPIAIDANQRWEVSEAIEWVNALAEFGPAWVEEPTSPDDILGHAEIARGIAPIRVATGEHAQNRMIFKQLLQANAIEVMQIDAVRVAGVNENIANLLLAAKFGVPVCPHAGGVGLCEAVQHLSMFDFVAVSGSREGRLIEFVDHLHEHFVVPTDIQGGSYMPPVAPGASMEMKAESIEKYAWTGAHVTN